MGVVSDVRFAQGMISKIVEGLYVGNQNASRDKDLLNRSEALETEKYRAS